MANKLLNMNKVRQLLLFLERGASQRSIARETGTNRKTIANYLGKFGQTCLSFSELLALDDRKLDEIAGLSKPLAEETDPRKVHFNSLIGLHTHELAKEGVTRLLLWEEYIKDYPEGFQYSRFCELLQEQQKLNSATMHFEHQPGKLLQVDFAGAPLHYVDLSTGEVIACPVFIAVLPFSGYGYVEALPNAKLPQVVKALNNTLDYLGGVPLGVKSDNMRQWVSKTCRYEPQFTEMLQQWSNHNHIALFAARAYKPKDKPAVEGLVKITYMRIYAKLRNETFHSLAELNQAIWAKLDQHHQINFQKKTFSRQELFTGQEKALLQALPETAYYIRHYTKAKVQKSYHVLIGEDWHYYSVPFRFIGKEVRLIYCQDTVEIYYNNQRIALHKRDYRNHKYTTSEEHMPASHQAHLATRGFSASYYLQKAMEAGPCTHAFFQKLMDSKKVIEQSYTSCLGLLRLISAYGPLRMEAACTRGLSGSKFTYTAIKNILANNMDLMEEQITKEYRIPIHVNLRGPEAYNEN